MPLQTANWEPNKDLPVGKGATIQQFFTTLGKDRFEINDAPRGRRTAEGERPGNSEDRRGEGSAPGLCQPQAGRRKIRTRRAASGTEQRRKAGLIPVVKAKLLEGKKRLVVGIANERGPLRTRAASGIPEFDKLLEKAKAKAPARSLVSIEDVGAADAPWAKRPQSRCFARGDLSTS